MRPLLLATLVILAGCTYANLSAHARDVRIADSTPTACENAGVVIGKGGGAGGGFVSNERLVEYAMNDARNKAGDLGANVVVLSPPQLGGATVISATVTGFAYRCAPGGAAPPGSVPAASK